MISTMSATPHRSDPLALPPVPPPAPAGHHSRDRLVVVMFVLALTLPLAGAVVKRNLETTAFENRRAALWPSAASALSSFRTFPPAFEAAFADRFGGRDKLIGLHHGTLMEVFGVSPVAKVMVGRDD